ncbi:hypothetical protein JTB14_020506 [Gonioctena quinquepunctata]|nr:hypothetical protein JTB14_020506 [Gonioctena quinquepunctata]
MTDVCEYSTQLPPYHQNPRIHDILHLKCPVIRLVRCQMNHVDTRLDEAIEYCRKRNTLTGRLWRNRWFVISCILLFFLMMGLFVYGTMVGAGMCSGGIWHPSLNAPCPKIFSFLPGINLVRSSPVLTF